MKKSVVLVDMDEVLVDMVSSWLYMYHSIGGELIEKSEIKSYSFEASGLVRDMPLFWKALDRAPAMRIAKPLEGAVEALKRLNEDPRFDVYIVTYARAESWGKAHEAKLAWMWQHCPWFDRDKIIFTRQKHLVDGDFLIEDNAETCEKWRQKMLGQAFLVNQPWNKNTALAQGVTRVNSLADAVTNLLEGI